MKSNSMIYGDEPVLYLKEAPVSDEDLQIVERCATALGINLTDEEWIAVWKSLRQGVSPYTVLAEIGITGPRQIS